MCSHEEKCNLDAKKCDLSELYLLDIRSPGCYDQGGGVGAPLQGAAAMILEAMLESLLGEVKAG